MGRYEIALGKPPKRGLLSPNKKHIEAASTDFDKFRAMLREEGCAIPDAASIPAIVRDNAMAKSSYSV